MAQPTSQEVEKKAPRIGNIAAGFLLFAALIVDGAQFLLDLSVILSPLTIIVGFTAMIMFTAWFYLFHGVSFINGKQGLAKLGTLMGTAIITVIPFVNGVPEITAGVFLTILLSRIEDKHIDVSAVAAAALSAARKTPLAPAAFAGKILLGSGARPVQQSPEGAQEYPA